MHKMILGKQTANFRRKKPFSYHSGFDDLLPMCHSCSKRKSISCEREVSKATPFTQASLQPSMASQFLGTKSRLSSRPWTLANSHSSQLPFHSSNCKHFRPLVYPYHPSSFHPSMHPNIHSNTHLSIYPTIQIPI